MANEQHLQVLRQGVPAWNAWRESDPAAVPDLIGASLQGAKLPGINLQRALLLRADLSKTVLERAVLYRAILGNADLSEADLSGAVLSRAELHRTKLQGAKLAGADLDHTLLHEADLRGADITGASLLHTKFQKADLRDADLRGAAHADTDYSQADLSGADLRNTFAGGVLFREANLSGANLGSAVLNQADLQGAKLHKAKLANTDLTAANLEEADLSEANLSGADLSRARLVRTNLKKAKLSGCTVYALSAWDLELEGAKQRDLRITDLAEPAIIVDDLAVAQLVHLLLHSPALRRLFGKVSSNIVLILGCFSMETEPAVDVIREVLRQRDYVPISFDLGPLTGGELGERLATIARMARFIILEATDVSSARRELRALVSELPSVPVQPLLLAGSKEPKLLEHLKRHSWVLATHRYKEADTLAGSLAERVIGPAELLAMELQGG